MARVLIIGGGVAGLSAGIYARRNGHTATVCEAHSVPGGNLTGWSREGYHIDNCIHWLTGTNPKTATYRMWEELGALGGVGIHQGESLYTYEHSGKRLSLYRDLTRLCDEMLEISPEDKREIMSFIRAVRCVQGVLGIGGVSHNEGYGAIGVTASLPSLIKYYRLTNSDLAKRFRHPLLKGFFVSFLAEEFGALAFIFVMAHYCADNAGVPMGGSLAMAERMARRFTSLGGELLMRSEVARIDHSKGHARSVTLTSGEVIDSDYIVITLDPATVFGRLLDMDMPKSLEKRYHDPRQMRFSSYQCAFACDTDSLPFVGDIVFDLPEKYRLRLMNRRLVIREFAHERSFAPEGKSIIQTISFCDERMANKFISLHENTQAYERRKKYLSRLITEAVEECIPELRGKIRCIDMWTPATYKRFVRSDMGSYMSFAFSKGIVPVCASGKVPGLDNAILATQWLQSPGGLPIAAESGREAIRTIQKMCGQKFV